MVKDVVCQKCGYGWITKSALAFVSCPSCLNKVKVDRVVEEEETARVSGQSEGE